MDWTDPTTGEITDGDVGTAAWANAYVENNTLYLKTHIALETAAELTISSGVITVTQGYHAVETEGGASSDNLDNIGGGEEGMVIILRASNDAHTVVVRTGVGGNIVLNNNISLDDNEKHIILICDGTNWHHFTLAPIGDGDIDASFLGLVTGALSETGQHAKIFSWQNTFGYSIIITQIFIEKTTGSTAAAKINVGQAATEIESDNLIDGASLQGTGVLNLIKRSGTNGLGSVVVADDEWITGYEDNSADPDGLVGNYYIYYVEQA